MKKTIVTLGLSLMTIIGIACPRPTSHAVVKIGATYDYSFASHINSVDNIGIGGSIGWESAERWSTISIDGGYTFGTKEWRVGGEYAFCPLAVVESPVNVKVLINSGYKSNKAVYGTLGLELDFGYNVSLITPYASAKFGFETSVNNFNPNWGVTAELGIRFWIGRTW